MRCKFHGLASPRRQSEVNKRMSRAKSQTFRFKISNQVSDGILQPFYVIIRKYFHLSACVYVTVCVYMQVKVNTEVATGTGPNKKVAKRNAAEAMLLHLGYKASTVLQNPTEVRTPLHPVTKSNVCLLCPATLLACAINLFQWKFPTHLK